MRIAVIGSVLGLGAVAAALVPGHLQRTAATTEPPAQETISPTTLARPAATVSASLSPAPTPVTVSPTPGAPTPAPSSSRPSHRTPRPVAVPETLPATERPAPQTPVPSPSLEPTPAAAPTPTWTAEQTPTPSATGSATPSATGSATSKPLTPTTSAVRAPGGFSLISPIDVSSCNREADHFTVSWTASEDAMEYTVSGIPNGATVAAPSTSVQVPCPSEGSTYYLVVTAMNDRNLHTSTTPVPVTFPEPLDDAAEVRMQPETTAALTRP